MQIIINGQPKTMSNTNEIPINLLDIIKQEGMDTMKVAVAQNGQFIPKNSYETKTVQDGDSIEIVSPMQGG